VLHSNNEYDDLINDYYNLGAIKHENIYAKIYFKDLVILYCGNYVKFAKLIKNPDKNHHELLAPNPDKETLHYVFENKKFHEINCIFDKKVEVIKLIETTKHHCV
jgi:hypothetical protein